MLKTQGTGPIGGAAPECLIQMAIISHHDSGTLMNTQFSIQTGFSVQNLI